jgi:predicted transcriptional regulator
MRINYKEFADAFSKSGLSMKAYGDQRGMSSSMVSYYLKRSKASESSIFKELEILPPRPKSKIIKIITSDGIQIEIPL